MFQENNSLATVDVIAPTSFSRDSPGKAASYRFQRTRQRLATYRHDLLVALRLINRVEKEVIQAEWERWVLQESRRCLMLGDMLSEQNAGDDEDGASAIKNEFAGRADIEQWYKDYCTSCQRERKRIEDTLD